MNDAPASVPGALPARCDVLVVGAGPAGSACATLLARGGLDVLLVDQHAFPRDKVCGDGLIPDAHRAFERLGVADEVRAAARHIDQIGCIAPRGGRIDVPGSLAVLPRKELDLLLCRNAQRAGARFLAPARFDALLKNDMGLVIGARLRTQAALHDVQTHWVVLATGAVPQAMLAAELCRRRTPSGVALRGYVRNPAMVERIAKMEIVWHKRLSQGYGWIFPAPGGVFNIGVGLAQSHVQNADGRGTMQDLNLRRMLDTFCEVHAPARELVAGGEWVGELKGAPLRSSLHGAHYSRPGLLATGEAIGSTYAFTYEGIGKAMETGLLAAEAILAEPRDEAAARAHYAAALAALKPKLDLYEKAGQVNRHLWLIDLLVWRARRNPRILRRMQDVLEEKSSPGHLITPKGLLRLFMPIGG